MKATQRGFSLIEVVVAIFVIGAVFLMYTATAKMIVLTRNQKYNDIALRVANNKIESIRAAGYALVPSSGSFSDPLLSSVPASSASLTTSDYNVKTKLVVVTVSWKEAGTASSTVSLTTLITQTGGL